MNNLLKRGGTPREISLMYGIPLGTLANMRYRKEGPNYYKTGKRVFYFIEDIEKWLKQNPVLTSDAIACMGINQG